MARSRDPERTHELLDACCDYAEHRGLAELTLRPLAAEVGVTPRTLLYHSGSREKPLIAVARRSRERGLADVATLLTRASTDLASFDPATAGIASLIESVAETIWRESLSEHARPFLLLFYEAYVMSLRQPDTYRQLLDQLASEAQQLAGAVLHRAGVPEDLADLTASQLVAAHRGLQLEWLATDRTAELTTAHRKTITQIAAHVVGPQSARGDAESRL